MGSASFLEDYDRSRIEPAFFSPSRVKNASFATPGGGGGDRGDYQLRYLAGDRFAMARVHSDTLRTRGRSATVNATD